MGSKEGYLIDEFLTLRTNQRSDRGAAVPAEPDAICRE
ncbi:hypothetical protein ACNKHS_18515 [Shigella flexneri]